MTTHALPWHTPDGADPAIRSWFPETTPELSMVSQPPESTTSKSGAVDPWELACIQETRQGRPEAFNPLVTRYAPRIRAYLHRMVRNHEEAEDLTQETFIKAFRALSQFNTDRPFRSWLYAIATNTGLNALRSRKRRGTPVEWDMEQIAAPERDTGGGPQEEALHAAMTRLSPRAARLVALHYQEGFSLAEAGAVLDLSENAAKVALCRARKQIRAYMVAGKQR